MRPDSRHLERGFSLVELMVAMSATLVVSGAVYGLVTAGHSAFRREPVLADRQQNIRMALDLIAQDVFQAGYGIPTFAQVFRDGLDGIGPQGSGGAKADELEVFRSAECPVLSLCPGHSLTAASVKTVQQLSACYSFPAAVIFANDSEWHMRWAEQPGKGEVGNACQTGESADDPRHGHVALAPGQSELNPPSGFRKDFEKPPTYILLGMAIRYRINVDADGSPNLERSAFGGQDDLDGNSTFQIIARGIEDLQVEYENALAPGWQDTPGRIDCTTDGGCSPPTADDYKRLIRRVRVRLSARVMEGGRFAGESTSVVGSAVRGQLHTEIAPRAALAALGSFRGEL